MKVIADASMYLRGKRGIMNIPRWICETLEPDWADGQVILLYDDEKKVIRICRPEDIIKTAEGEI